MPEKSSLQSSSSVVFTSSTRKLRAPDAKQRAEQRKAAETAQQLLQTLPKILAQNNIEAKKLRRPRSREATVQGRDCFTDCFLLWKPVGKVLFAPAGVQLRTTPKGFSRPRPPLNPVRAERSSAQARPRREVAPRCCRSAAQAAAAET